MSKLNKRKIKSTVYPAESIEQAIYIVRGYRVMLDHDLAALYQVETRSLVQAVKRNIKRFPEDFMFSLSNQELTALRSQTVISKGRGGRRTTPYAFTEQGIAMLSSVLSSERAVKVNIEIMRTFVRLRRMLQSNDELSKKLNTLEQKYDSQFKIVFDAIREIMSPTQLPQKPPIGFQANNK